MQRERVMQLWEMSVPKSGTVTAEDVAINFAALLERELLQEPVAWGEFKDCEWVAFSQYEEDVAAWSNVTPLYSCSTI